VVQEEDAEEVLKMSREQGIEAYILGRVFKDAERKVEILPKKLVGIKGDFFKVT
jgi:phosphoribosylaminoimidazole (AIR) synthetase